APLVPVRPRLELPHRSPGGEAGLTRNTMRAAVYYGPRDIRLEEAPVPTPGAGEVLIEVLRSGLCGTDVTEWVAGPKLIPLHSRHPHSGHVGPMIPGHEMVGRVVESDSPDLPPGTLVAGAASVPCWDCDRCREGTSSAALATSFIHFEERMSSDTSTVPAWDSTSVTSASRPAASGWMAPTVNHEADGGVSRTTVPGSNMFEAISITAPIVRSGPTAAAMSSIDMPFWRPTTRPSSASTDLMSSQPQRVS